MCNPICVSYMIWNTLALAKRSSVQMLQDAAFAKGNFLLKGFKLCLGKSIMECSSILSGSRNWTPYILRQDFMKQKVGGFLKATIPINRN